MAALTTRSGRNPRCLAAFLAAGRPYDLQGPQDGDAGDILESILRERIAAARREAVRRGATQAEVAALLAGLAMLPPPVPLDELAAAQGLTVGDIESFATDLAPLLERTRYGLMFRDEPTETLIRKMSHEDPVARDLVITRLEKECMLVFAMSCGGKVMRLIPPASNSALRSRTNGGCRLLAITCRSTCHLGTAAKSHFSPIRIVAAADQHTPFVGRCGKVGLCQDPPFGRISICRAATRLNLGHSTSDPSILEAVVRQARANA